jgi:hypothetical protein
MLFLTSIISGVTTAKNPVRSNASVVNSNVGPRHDPALIKITGMDAVCDLDNDFVVYGEDSTLYIYNIKTGLTDNVSVGGSIVYPKISEKRVVYYDFQYMGFKLYNITTGNKTSLIVTNWPGGDTDDFQFFGDYLVYQNYSLDIYATEIYLYNIATGENIKLTDTPGDAFPENPSIYNDVVAWQLTNGAQADIFTYTIDNHQYAKVTNASRFEANTFPSIYENKIAYSYFYYDKVNGTRLYGLKMYNIATGKNSTIFEGGEPTANSPELYGNMIVYSESGGRLRLYNLSTNFTTTIYEGSFLTQPWNLNDYYVLFTILGEGAYLYQYNYQPSIEITIRGGLGVSATIMNMGTKNLTNVSWNIALDGKLIFIGKNKPGTIDVLAAGESKTVRDFVFGFGKAGVLVSAGSTTQNATATVIFFFVLGIK